MKKFLKNYWFILCMLTGIVAGCLVGAFAPAFGGKIEFLGTLFIVITLFLPDGLVGLWNRLRRMRGGESA